MEIQNSQKFYVKLSYLWLAVVVLISTSCETVNTREDAATFIDEWREKARVSREKVADEAQARSLGRIEKKVKQVEKKPEVKYLLPTDPVTLQMKDAEVRVILQGLANMIGKNLVMTDTEGLRASVDLKDVPWNEVFDTVLTMNSLTYTEEKNIIKVMTRADIESQLEFKELMHRVQEAQKRSQELEELHTRTIKINHLEAKDISEILDTMLGSDDTKIVEQINNKRESVAFDEKTNTVIVTTNADTMNRVLSVVEELDKPQLQVIVEAKIVIAQKEVGEELGTEWTVAQSGNPLLGNTELMDLFDDDEHRVFENSLVGGLQADGRGVLGGMAKVGEFDVTALLRALEEESLISIESTPSITTLDNHTAFIESGNEIPYQTTDDGTTTTEFKSATLRLEVTPHIIDNRFIKLNVHTSKDEVDQTLTNTDGEPGILTRSSETTLLLADGETTVIAGLNESNDSEGNSGIPLLKDLPYIGYMFSSSTSTSKFSDLLIFITPKIVKNEAYLLALKRAESGGK